MDTATIKRTAADLAFRADLSLTMSQVTATDDCRYHIRNYDGICQTCTTQLRNRIITINPDNALKGYIRYV